MIDQGKLSRNETYHNIVRGSAAPRRSRVLNAIRDAGERGTTTDELSVRLRCFPNQVSGRVTELKALGLVTHTAQRRRTRSGATASVIVAVVGGRKR